jgi:hypothetical protein
MAFGFLVKHSLRFADLLFIGGCDSIWTLVQTTHEKFSRKFSSKVPQLVFKNPTLTKNFLENFSQVYAACVFTGYSGHLALQLSWHKKHICCKFTEEN